jgi:antitoxin (DNA-binding transcriptional repressor) of toxin-antitoxin stability system
VQRFAQVTLTELHRDTAAVVDRVAAGQRLVVVDGRVNEPLILLLPLPDDEGNLDDR